MIQKEIFGQYHEQPVYRYIIRNKNGVELSCLSYGAFWQRLQAPILGEMQDLILSSPSLLDYLGQHHGATLGRTAGRIGENQYAYPLPANEGKTIIHGGVHGFDTLNWDADVSDQSVEFKHRILAEDDGFPGDLDARVKYTLTDDNDVVIDYAGLSNETSLFNPTSHVYFNLNADDETIMNHNLWLASEAHFELDQKQVPTKKQLNNEATPFSFSQTQNLGDAISGMQSLPEKGFDDVFALDEHGVNDKIAELSLPERKVAIQLYTDRDALVMYTANGWDNSINLIGKTSRPYIGVALEMQNVSNAINDITIEPGQWKSYRNRYHIAY